VDRLTQAIEGVDLPDLVARLWPESGARPGRPGLYRAAWRGDRKPSLSLFRARGVWFFRDHATGQSGNAYHLLRAAGLSKEEAVAILLGERPLPKLPRPPRRERPRARPPVDLEKALAEAQARLRGEKALPKVLEGRGIALEEAVDLWMGLSPEGDLLLPIYDPEGRVVAVKVRHQEPRDGQRYRYLTRGSGTPPWYGPGFGHRNALLVVEGELNAVALYLAVGDLLDVVGVAGVNGTLPEPDGRPTFLLLDGDEAGQKAAERWQAALGGHVLPPLEGGDACEVAARAGREALRKEVLARVAQALLESV
jgi:putative DNA primase/helicase